MFQIDARLSIVALIALAASVFAQSKGAEEPDPEPPAQVSEALRREILDALKMARRVNRETDELIEATRRKLVENVLVSTVINQRVEAPPVADPPDKPTLEFCIPRAIQWLVSNQRSDGTWDASRRANALASTALLKHETDTFASQIGSLRIRLRASRKRGIGLVPKEPGTLRTRSSEDLTAAILAECELSGLSLRGTLRAQVRSAVAELRRRERELGSHRPQVRKAAQLEARQVCWVLIARIAAMRCDIESSIGDSSTELLAKDDSLRLAAVMLLTHLLRQNSNRSRTSAGLAVDQPKSLCRDVKNARDLESVYLWARATSTVNQQSASIKLWREGIIGRILKSQRGDGAWGSSDQTTDERIVATALALLCIDALSD